MKFHIGKTIIDGIEYRKCRCCRKVKVLNEENFLRRDTQNGWRGRCRLCYNANERLKQESNNTEKQRYKNYRDKNKSLKPLDYIFRTAKGNAKRGFREFSIEKKDVYELWEKQNGICYYTNKPMKYDQGTYDSVSLDRIDSSKGYVIGNIALTQYKVNIMKNNANLEELFDFCESILNNKEQIINKLNKTDE